MNEMSGTDGLESYTKDARNSAGALQHREIYSIPWNSRQKMQ